MRATKTSSAWKEVTFIVEMLSSKCVQILNQYIKKNSYDKKSENLNINSTTAAVIIK